MEQSDFDFHGIPMGHSRVLKDDEYGFTTVLRVPGGWIVRMHEIRGDKMTSEVKAAVFVQERQS